MNKKGYKLWHQRMGHLGAQNLQRLPKLVSGIDDSIDLKPPEQEICEGCMSGRQHRLPFPDSNTERELLELIHSDLCGPMRIKSIAGARYVLSFIDHHSRYPSAII